MPGEDKYSGDGLVCEQAPSIARSREYIWSSDGRGCRAR